MTTASLLKESALTLRSLCASIGISKAGTKPVLVQRIRHAATNQQPLPPEARILSIDMGIKNFAFSLLTPAALDSFRGQEQDRSKTTPLTTPVRLHVWKRLDLTLPVPVPATIHTKTPTSKKKKTPSPNNVEDFSPATLSQHALNLVQTQLLPLRPTHVLIERQRFRSGGQAAVFEWTLRVNSLEAMLHALFASFYGRDAAVSDGRAERGGRAFEGRVESVLPGGVVNFLLCAEDGMAGRGRVDGQRIKKVKTEIVGGFLREGVMVVPEAGQQAEEMVSVFLEQWERAGGRKGRAKKGGSGGGSGSEKGPVREVRNKLDDLADAVLQGMVWLQWQRNLEALIKERPDLLGDAGKSEKE
ncbi:mitochondrial resolvase Ydc2 [Parathielavia hyrcaniae]|uniref:Mitochondrial resolvase Ydc2 n=1 Tax=Parathielavia hyrcaniae TaxID=113614 RepID=A0AAN6Q361_9PEZI|nr:mitochondrial resolvase Ydc2 [Parathielavia hyrcaniae]